MSDSSDPKPQRQALPVINTPAKVDQLRNPNSVWWKQYALYARDHWQIGRRVTLTYGLRWELFGVPRKDHTGINRFDQTRGRSSPAD